jgi:hypothetical protein
MILCNKLNRLLTQFSYVSFGRVSSRLGFFFVWFNIKEKFVLFSFLFKLEFLFRLFRIYVSIWIRTTSYSGYLKTYIEVVHMSSKIEGV